MHGLGQVRGHIAHDRALYRADVGDDCAGRKVWADLLCDLTAGSDRDANDHQVGAFDGSGIAFNHLIGEAELGDAPARLRRPRGCYNCPHCALRACRTRDRGADQPNADESQPIEQGRRLIHAGFPTNSLSACTTSRLASSVPTLIRKAFGSL